MIQDLYFKVLRHKATIPASVGVASFAVGTVSGYFLARYRITKKIREELSFYDDGEEYTEEDLHPQLELPFDSHETTEEFFKRMVKGNVLPAVEFTEKDMEEIVKATSHGEYEDVDTDTQVVGKVEPETVNIFRNEKTDWDLDEELKNRDESHPYIIHVEEFVNEEAGYDQTTLTYYEGDEILVDERDVPIYNPTQVVGELKFGHGSDDRNTCYVRNDQLKSEYEILLDRGYYQEEVLGMSIQEHLTSEGDLKHSHHKFRMDE